MSPKPRIKPTGVVHAVRSWRQFYQPIVTGLKTHDLRKNDRNYQVGDVLLLQEYDMEAGCATGSFCYVQITFMTDRDHPCAFSSAVLEPGYAILSITPVEYDVA